jgi:UDP-3-O-[3-hydroxymyristoyl] glucosamine N-acyltransferase
VITIDVSLGKHCHINLNSTIGHDTTLGDYVTVSPGVNISGNVHIGKNCYIGTNASIKEHINICDNTVIGMGSVVVKNIETPGIYVGIPARRM